MRTSDTIINIDTRGNKFEFIFKFVPPQFRLLTKILSYLNTLWSGLQRFYFKTYR